MVWKKHVREGYYVSLRITSRVARGIPIPMQCDVIAYLFVKGFRGLSGAVKLFTRDVKMVL
jgi:hypothetical protein